LLFAEIYFASAAFSVIQSLKHH